MPHTYNIRPLPGTPHAPRRRPIRIVFIALSLLVLIGIYVAYALLRPIDPPKLIVLPPVISGEVGVNVPWPSAGQAAYGADGLGLLASHNEQSPVPTASIAKAITALAVLEKKPLSPGQPGPTITISAEDAALYDEYIAKDGSAVPTRVGLEISQYQALQAMMLPSANNIADLMARWAFGSMEGYRTYASGMVKRLGMAQTTIGTDASGYSPTTLSTASDLVRLGDAVMDNAVLSEIISQQQAVFPEYGTMNNVNNLLGTAGIRGIKTGNTDEAGGCFLGAADVVINGKKVTVITAILGSTTRTQALRETVPMAQAAVSLFRTAHISKAGENFGHVTTQWGTKAAIVADKEISLLAWNGSSLSPKLQTKPLPDQVQAGTSVGELTLQYGGQTYASKLRTDTGIAEPSAAWRLSHPF